MRENEKFYHLLATVLLTGGIYPARAVAAEYIVTDLAMLGVFSDAYGINDVGQIVGFGFMGGIDMTRAFLLTPVPEPTSAVMLFIGLLAVWRRRSIASCAA